LLQLDVHLFGWRELCIATAAFSACLCVILAAKVWPRIAGRSQDLNAVQSAHKRITPRLGGIGLLVTLVLMGLLAPSAIQDAYLKLFISGLIVFTAGFLEDIGIGVSPKLRLLAALASSLTLIFFLEVWLPQLGIPLLDHYAANWPIGIPLTLFITIGVSNGFNLIDGVNGLSGLTAMIGAVALAFIAEQAGYTNLVPLCIMLAAGIFGFWVLNFPFGLIFLGDAGAYVLGFILSWFGIAILIVAPNATPWAILLTVFWPVADTALAIYRRKITRRPNMQPDRLHVHQLVMRSLELTVLSRAQRRISNPLTTLALAPFIIAPAIVGVVFWDNTLMAFLSFIAFSCLFFLSYWAAFPIMRRLRPNYDARTLKQVAIKARQATKMK
jgi:UDP-GlcNAc:undecaprenyl-phosphate/decaprenyl-phosphate GlcNAc-1-phosphate transferase